MSGQQILQALKCLSLQVMELEKRIESLECTLTQNRNPLMQLLAAAEDESDTDSGYDSAPATFLNRE